ncbi:MAG: 2'-5' RNA ligase family protein [Proteobacteria bacterium]|nr:2'-5' RNA ligase family protein [Pseudomonadota bacterium]
MYPDAQAAQRILELAQAVRARHSLRGAARPTALTHVTLHYLGDHDGLPESLVAAAASAAQRVSMERFRLRFDRVASFAGRSRNRACVLRNDDPQANAPLRALHDALGRELRASGLGHVLGAAVLPRTSRCCTTRRRWNRKTCRRSNGSSTGSCWCTAGWDTASIARCRCGNWKDAARNPRRATRLQNIPTCSANLLSSPLLSDSGSAYTRTV